MNSATFSVYSPTLPKMREAASSLARKALGEGVTFWLTPEEPARIKDHTLMGEITEWYQEWEVKWAEDADDLLDD